MSRTAELQRRNPFLVFVRQKACPTVFFEDMQQTDVVKLHKTPDRPTT